MELKEQIKIIFFDVDHTAFDHIHYEVRPLTMYALRKLKEKGYKLCISTSRSLDEMQKIDKDFIELADVISTLAGAYVIYQDHKEYFTINHNDVKKLVEYFDNKHIPYRYATNDGMGYLSETNEYIDNLFYEYYHMIPPVKKYEGEEVTQIMYYTFDTSVHNIVKTLAPNLIVNNMKLNSEISSGNIDKGNIMKKIALDLGHSLDETMAFGDSENDNTMLKNAYFGVCVGNGVDNTKNIADYVCEKQEEDGIYKTFVKYGFIEPYKEEHKELFDTIIQSANMYASSLENINKACEIFKETILKDGVIQMLGVGKLEEFSQELYYRAGGLVPFHKMSLLEASSLKELESLYKLDDRDAYLLISESGDEDVLLSLAKKVKDNNQKLVTVVRNIKDDSIIDYADVNLKLLDNDDPIKITCDNTLAQIISFRTYELLKNSGINPPIFMSNNNPDAKKHNEEVLKKYKERVHK